MDMIKDFLYSEMSIEELYKEVIFFINPDKTPASPTPADVIIAMDTSV